MQPSKVHDEILACGYKKCCPRVETFEDGSVTLTDDDAEIGSVGTIKLSPESAKRLAELIQSAPAGK